MFCFRSTSCLVFPMVENELCAKEIMRRRLRRVGGGNSKSRRRQMVPTAGFARSRRRPRPPRPVFLGSFGANPEIRRLSEQISQKGLIAGPSPYSEASVGVTTWPEKLAVYFISIRPERAAAFQQRLGSSITATLFPGTRGRVGGPNGLRPGEMGCDQSHRRLWAQMAKEASAVILAEDDVHLVGSSLQITYLRTLLQEAQEAHVDLMYLSWFQGYSPRGATPAVIAPHLRSLIGFPYLQLWCLWVSPAGLAKISNYFPIQQTPQQPIDVALCEALQLGRIALKAAVAWPPLCWTVGASSDTAP